MIKTPTVALCGTMLYTRNIAIALNLPIAIVQTSHMEADPTYFEIKNTKNKLEYSRCIIKNALGSGRIAPRVRTPEHHERILAFNKHFRTNHV